MKTGGGLFMKKRLIIICLLIVLTVLSACGKAESDEKIEIFDDYAYFKMGLVPAKRNGKWGFINKKMDFVIEPQFDHVGCFTPDGVARVGIKKGIKDYVYGYIDTSGNFIVEPVFPSAEDFKNGCAKVYKRMELKPYYINTKGEKCVRIINNHKDEPEKLVAYHTENGSGYVNRENDVIIGTTYEDTRPFTEGLGAVRKEGKWGFINFDEEFIIEPSFDDVWLFSEGLAAVKIDNKWGFINKEGDLVIEPAYDIVREFTEGFATVKIDKKWGYIDKSGEWYVEPLFDEAKPFYDGIACVRSGKKWGYIDTKGLFLRMPEFDSAENFDASGLAVVGKDGKYGYINKEGEIVIDLQYSIVSHFGEGDYAKVSYDYFEYGYNNPYMYDFYLIDKEGNKLMEKAYDEYCFFSDGYILCHVADCSEFVLIAPDGKIVATEKDFEDIYQMNIHYY